MGMQSITVLSPMEMKTSSHVSPSTWIEMVCFIISDVSVTHSSPASDWPRRYQQHSILKLKTPPSMISVVLKKLIVEVRKSFINGQRG